MRYYLSAFLKKIKKNIEKSRKYASVEVGKSVSAPMPYWFYSADGNAAAAVSTAAVSFASMARMMQSMAAVKMTEKRDVLLMVRFLSNGKKVFLKFCVQ